MVTGNGSIPTITANAPYIAHMYTHFSLLLSNYKTKKKNTWNGSWQHLVASDC